MSAALPLMFPAVLAVLALLSTAAAREKSPFPDSVFVGYAVNDSLGASLFLRVSLQPWTDGSSTHAENWRLSPLERAAVMGASGNSSNVLLVANISVMLNAGAAGNASSDPFEVHAYFAAAELDSTGTIVSFPTVFDPASDLEQFLLHFMPLLGNTSCLFGKLDASGSMNVTLGDAFPIVVMMPAEAPLPSVVPRLWRSVTSGASNDDSVRMEVSIRGAVNTAAQIFLWKENATSTLRNRAAVPLFASASMVTSDLGCALRPVLVDAASLELRVGGTSLAESCLTAAWQRTVDPTALMRMMFLAPSRIVVFPQRGTAAKAIELVAVDAPTPLAEGAAYCGNYAGTPQLRLTIENVSTSSSGMQVVLGFEVRSQGFSQMVHGVIFDVDATGFLNVDRTVPAAATFFSVIGSVGRSPWIEIDWHAAVDSFWVTISLGAFALTRCG
jgi:hypothetical protein